MTTAADLAAFDPLSLCIAWLGAHDKVTEALGGAGRVGGTNLPPYPRLMLTDPPGGSDRDMRWQYNVRVQVEALGDLSGRPGKAALRQIIYVAIAALTELPQQPVAPGAPVVTGVTAFGGGGWLPLPNDQPRYLTSVTVHGHPPVLAPVPGP